MKKQLFAIYDTKAECAEKLHEAVSLAEFMRSLTDHLNASPGENPSLMQQHPAHFDAYYLGEWDTNSCLVDGKAEKTHLCNLSTLVKEQS